MYITIAGEALASIRPVFTMAKGSLGGSALLVGHLVETVSNSFHSIQYDLDVPVPRNYMLIAMTFHIG